MTQSLKNIISLCLFTFILSSCSTENEPVSKTETPAFETLTLGGSKNDSGQAIKNTTDGGYVILGYTQSNDGDVSDKSDESFDYWVLKFSADHQLQWSKTYGGSNEDKGQDIIQTNDGGYAVLGYSNSIDGDVTSNAGLKDYWVCKLNVNGELLWQKSFGYSGNDSGFSIISTTDQGFLITGILDVSASGGEGNSRATKHAGGDYWVIKLNAEGEKMWSRYYGGTFTDTPYDVIETSNNQFIIAGSSDSSDVDISNNLGSYDFWIIKISDNGTLLWNKNFGGKEIDEAFAIAQTDDGNFIIAGDTRSQDQNVSYNNGAADVWIIKITPEGQLIWEKTFGGLNFDAARSIYKTTNNTFLIAGSSRSSDGNLTTNNSQNDAWIFEIDSQANVIWQQSIGGSAIDFAYGITQLNNQQIVTIGNTNSSDLDISENKGFTDLLIIKQTP